jgi:hypothetical protein
LRVLPAQESRNEHDESKNVHQNRWYGDGSFRPAASCDGQTPRATPKLVLVAGGQSHTYMAHEHYAAFVLIKKWLEAANAGLQVIVCRNGWPKDESVFDGATALAVNGNGERSHPLNGHLPKLDALRKRGVGLSLIHFATIIDKGPPADRASNGAAAMTSPIGRSSNGGRPILKPSRSSDRTRRCTVLVSRRVVFPYAFPPEHERRHADSERCAARRGARRKRRPAQRQRRRPDTEGRD